ncbi:hypothetical protein [Chitiniphilus shinanonensis]|uniref:hypothetical protein n=1 Tax=Chitiniphilus shinanonensis TaxID=553088 RepID=UPI0033406F3B
MGSIYLIAKMCNNSPYPAESLKAAIGFLLLVIVWFVAHPYRGVVHDARLYLAQGIYLENPLAFANDLFFRFGSQDKYTLFTNLYSFALKFFGMKIILPLWFFFQLVWISAIYFICRSKLPANQAFFVSLCVAAVGNNYYGGKGIFEYSEGFLTARVAAESFSLLAIALAMNSRKGCAIGTGLVALIFHPLMAVWAIFPVAAICYPNPRIMARLALVLAAIGLPLFFVCKLYLPIDPIWQEQTIRGVPYLYYNEWSPQQKIEPLLSLLNIFMAFMVAKGRFRILLFAILIQGSSGHLLTWAASYFDNLFLLKVQPWRIEWMTTVFSKISIGYILVQVFLRNSDTIKHIFLPIFFIYLLSPSIWLGLVLTTGWSLLVTLKRPRLAPSISKYKYLVWCIPLFFFLAAGMEIFNFRVATPIYSDSSLEFFPYLLNSDFKWFIPPILWAIAFRSYISVLSAFTGIWAIVLLNCWDVRSPLLKVLESDVVSIPNTMRLIIRPGDLVYWPENPELTWILFRTAHFESGAQAAGMIFSRENALETENRHRIAQILYKHGFLDFNSGTFEEFCRRSHVRALIVPANRKFYFDQYKNYYFTLQKRQYGVLLCP